MRKQVRRNAKHLSLTRQENITPTGREIAVIKGDIELERPKTTDKDVWRKFWATWGDSWRLEIEIDKERQDYLKKRCSIKVDIAKGIYPFKNITLTRADVEWLIAAHSGIYSEVPVLKSLDLRRANLRGVSLSHLPLSGICAGINWDDTPVPLSAQETEAAAAHFEGASLDYADLKNACLDGAHFEGALLYGAHLENATLSFAHLQGADLSNAYLDKANLFAARLENSYLRGATLIGASLASAIMTQAYFKHAKMQEIDMSEVKARGAIFQKADLEGAKLFKADVQLADFSEANLKGVEGMYADLQKADLSSACLREAYLEFGSLKESKLTNADLQAADLMGAHLEKANLSSAHFEGAKLVAAFLQGAELNGTFFDTATLLRGVTLGDKQYGCTSLIDIRWGDVNLSQIRWDTLKMLGNEEEARRCRVGKERKKNKAHRVSKYQNAVRANRQLALILQSQGINELASHYAYQANRLQRIVFRHQRKFGQYLFSLFIDLIAGYGYKPQQSALAYLIVIFGFMGLYLLNAHFAAPHLSWDEALVLSISSFHGRGFFTQDITLGDPYARISAAEAVVGLLIELSFIATFTQRYFGK